MGWLVPSTENLDWKSGVIRQIQIQECYCPHNPQLEGRFWSDQEGGALEHCWKPIKESNRDKGSCKNESRQ